MLENNQNVLFQAQKMADRLKTIRIAAAEFIGTAFLVAFGCSCCTQALSAETWTIFHAAVGFGLIIGLIVMVRNHTFCTPNTIFNLIHCGR
jgi:glycerol uptake facilitator-like aquaporin